MHILYAVGPVTSVGRSFLYVCPGRGYKTPLKRWTLAVRDDLKNMSVDLQSRLGHEFRNPDLLKVALTHRSYHFENKIKSLGHFERLEFLGDTVLDLILSELLMDKFPDVDEGALSKWRASLVNEATLGEIAREFDLAKFLYLGKSEEAQRRQARARLLASAYEALLAAVYLDGGLPAAQALVRRHFEPRLATLKVGEGFSADFKTKLQEWAQRKFRVTPEYRLIDSEGPEHQKVFRYAVTVGAEALGQGSGGSRKAAEQDAAEHALKRIAQTELGGVSHQ